MNNLTNQIITQFNTWKFKRAHPYRIIKIIDIINKSINCNQPIPFIAYWGIGDKYTANGKENNTLKHLKNMELKIKEIYPPGITVLFLLSDMHALNNHIKKEKILQYINSIKTLLTKYSYDFTLLSDLYKHCQLTPSIISQKTQALESVWWKNFSLRKTLLKQASHVSLNKNINKSALRYAIMRIEESKILEAKYKNYISITHSSPNLQPLYPDMPTLYLYSERKGCTKAPWFNYD